MTNATRYVGSTWARTLKPTPMTFEQAAAKVAELNATDPDVKAGNSPYFVTGSPNRAAL